MSNGLQSDPKQPVLWLNGRLMPVAAVRIDPADRGWTLGDGVFETIYCPEGRPAHLDAHLDRFAEGAMVLAIPLPLTLAGIALALASTLAANLDTNLDTDRTGAAVVRLTLTRGVGPRGLLPPPLSASLPTLLITSTLVTGVAVTAPLGLSVIIATVTRRNEMSPLARIKSLNYLDGVLARIEAGSRGADDAILLNTKGLVAEATASNLLAVFGGRLVTPPVADGALPGIQRRAILDKAGACEASLSVSDLLRADEVISCNSLGLHPLVSIDGHPVGTGAPGRVFARLASMGLHLD
ncbi:MAG: aminotransferase class IV [Rhodospirillaceae bacterium]